MARLYHGFRRKDEHTVIPGIITSIEDVGDKYHVEYIKRTKSRVRISNDFDDIGNRHIEEAYHYNQKSDKGDL